MTATGEGIRNIAVGGHGSTGKTTLIDQLLELTGAVSGHHSVDEGTSICDFDEEEKHHKHTIEAKLAHFDYDGLRFNLFDTPGYPDFIGQTIGALHGVDNALIVVNAHAGIGVNTRRVFQLATEMRLGKIIVVNHLDDENLDYPALIESFQELWGPGCIPFNVPIGQGPDFRGVASVLDPPADGDGALLDPKSLTDSLLETIIEVDEAATERYFEGEVPDREQLQKLIVQAVAEGHLVPVVAVSGKTGAGLRELLDVLKICTVPADQVKKRGTHNGDVAEVASRADGPLVAQVFKNRVDPFIQKLSYLRIYSGKLHKDDTVHASSARKDVRIGQLLAVQGGETTPIDEAVAGDIVAVGKMDDLHVGTSLGEVELPPFDFPQPMVGLAAMPKSRGDEAKLSGALQKIVEEDPTFHVDRDAQTKELVITGISELHLQLVQEKIKRRDKVELETHEPKIPYRETIQAEAEGSYRHKKQSGGRGQFGEVHIRMYPFPKGTDPEEFCTKARFPQMREFHHDPAHNFVWIDSIVGGSIPNNFLPAVEKGFKERIERGVIAGYRVQDVAVEVHYGKHHPVDSSEAAFKTAGSMAFRNVFQQAKPSLLEPVVRMHVVVPGESVGDVNSDMAGRRGRVIGMEPAGGGLQAIDAEAPLAEVSTYARVLSSMTGGQGSFTMEFDHYEPVPGNVQKEIIAKAQLGEEEED